MKETLEYIISSIVDDPKQVAIKEEDIEGTRQFTITVAQEDIGKVIGKEGKIIRAIRNVMKIPATKQGIRVQIALA